MSRSRNYQRRRTDRMLSAWLARVRGRYDLRSVAIDGQLEVELGPYVMTLWDKHDRNDGRRRSHAVRAGERHDREIERMHAKFATVKWGTGWLSRWRRSSRPAIADTIARASDRL